MGNGRTDHTPFDLPHKHPTAAPVPRRCELPVRKSTKTADEFGPGAVGSPKTPLQTCEYEYAYEYGLPATRRPAVLVHTDRGTIPGDHGVPTARQISWFWQQGLKPLPIFILSRRDRHTPIGARSFSANAGQATLLPNEIFTCKALPERRHRRFSGVGLQVPPDIRHRHVLWPSTAHVWRAFSAGRPAL